jgi:PKD domain
MRNTLLAVPVLSAVLLSTGCTVHQQSAPGLSGPSGLAISLKMTATPDSVTQDGASRSTITVAAFDASGQAIAKQVQLTLFGPGTLSKAAVQTPDSVIYTPPASTSGAPTVVTIGGTVVDVTGASSAIAGCGASPCPLATPQVSLTIRPAGAIASTAPLALMNVSTGSPSTSQAVTFDASPSCGSQLVAGACPNTSALTGFSWSFLDNATGSRTSASGQIVNHSFQTPGTFTVTLIATNDKGVQGSTSQSFLVSTAVAPTAAFVVSPGTIHVNNTVNFNAAASKAATGHSIQQFIWNFGNGTSQTTTSSSLTVPTAFTSANTFKVTLTVVDDLGQTATTEVDVTVVP